MNILDTMGITYQNEVKVTMLLAGLRPEYKFMVNILHMIPDVKVTQALRRKQWN